MDAETKQELLSISLLMRKNAEKEGEKTANPSASPERGQRRIRPLDCSEVCRLCFGRSLSGEDAEKVGIDKEEKKNRTERFPDGSAIEYDESGMPVRWWNPKALPPSVQDVPPSQNGSAILEASPSVGEVVEQEVFGTSDKGNMKRFLVNVLRWVGVAVLPPVGLFVGGIIVRMSASSAYRYLDVDPQNPGIINLPVVIGESLIAGSLLPLTSYLLAPRHKFFTCAIVTAVYATFFLICFVVFFFHCHPDWLETLKQVAILGGMVGGAVYVKDIVE